MAFAQLTYQESLRDIEACLSAQPAALYHMGFRGPIRRSNSGADANETRDWRIYAEFAHRLIAQARRLYLGESLSVDLKDTVYALDSTTIDLLPVIVPVGALPVNQGRGEDAYIGSICAATSRVSSTYPTARCNDVHALDMILLEAGAIYVMDRGYVDFARLYGLHQNRRIFRDLREIQPQCSSGVFGRRRPHEPASSPIETIHARRALHEQRLSDASPEGTVQRSQNWKDAGVSYQPNSLTGKRRFATYTKAAGRLSCFSNGSNSTCGSNSSMGPPRTR